MKQYTEWIFAEGELDEVWELLKTTGAFYRETPREHFELMLERGLLQLWVEPDIERPVSVLVTELRGLNDEKTCYIHAFAGKNPDPVDGLKRFESIKHWARMNNCVEIIAYCEDPQMRLFARLGFVKQANVISLELEHGQIDIAVENSARMH